MQVAKNIKSVDVSGRRFSAFADAGFCFDDISKAGWIRISSVGSENIYFEFKSDDGKVHLGYSKVL